MVRLLDRQIHRLDDFKNGWACKALDGQRYPNKFILGWDSNGPKVKITFMDIPIPLPIPLPLPILLYLYN